MPAKEEVSPGWSLMQLAAKQIVWVLIKVCKSILEVAAWEKESCREVSSSHRFLLELWILCKQKSPKQTHLPMYSLLLLVLVKQEIYGTGFYITALQNPLQPHGQLFPCHFIGEKHEMWRQ